MLSSLLAIAGGGCVTAGVPLDETVLSILLGDGSDTVEVSATLRDASGASVALDDGQTVEINGTELTERRAGELEAEIPAADSYQVTVREPSRGVFQDTIEAPSALAITSPAADSNASLTGFDMSWAAVDGSDVTIVLRQTLLGVTETATFGPVPDTGTQSFSASDLQDFRQGASLEITLQRVTGSEMLSGIENGTVAFSQETSIEVNPSP